MRRNRGDLRVRFARAAADELLFLVVAVLFLVLVLFRDDEEVEDLVDDGVEA